MKIDILSLRVGAFWSADIGHFISKPVLDLFNSDCLPKLKYWKKRDQEIIFFPVSNTHFQ